MKKIKTQNSLKKFLAARYRDFVLKPAFKLIKRHQEKAKIKFWTMPFDAICKAQILNGFYEKELLEGMCKLALDKDGVALDIGANVGNHSLFLASQFSHVVAFEPVPRNCWILKSNIHLNNIKNITVIEKGLSDRNRKMVINNLDPENTNTPLGELDDRFSDHDSVDVVVGDQLVSELVLSRRICLIKIDVEGHEVDVVRGLTKTIEKCKPLIFWEAFNLEEVNKTRRVLESIGYRNFYHLSSNGFEGGLLGKALGRLGRSTVLMKIDECQNFDGLNVASVSEI